MSELPIKGKVDLLRNTECVSFSDDMMFLWNYPFIPNQRYLITRTRPVCGEVGLGDMRL